MIHPPALRIILEPGEDKGYTVSVPSLPGCISEGDTREEAIENIREAIELYLEPDDGQIRNSIPNMSSFSIIIDEE